MRPTSDGSDGGLDPAIAPDDPRRPDVVALLEAHLALMRSLSPPGSVHALDLDGLCAPDVTFWTLREGGVPLSCGALRALEPLPNGNGHDSIGHNSIGHGEIKSMHTLGAARGRGLGERMLLHVMAVARARGYGRLSLETGRPASFGAAQRLYARHGFRECPPFGSYTHDPFSLCMTRTL